MQNKGFVKFFALLLTLVCLFYLSFSVVTSHFESKYENMVATEGQEAADRYMDSLQNNKVYLGIWTLKDCREMGIGLGLDLKGGMNVVLEVSVPDVVKALSDHKEETDETFRKAVEQATKEATQSQKDFITLFVKDYRELAPERPLAELFATQQLRDKVTTKSTDKEVEQVLRSEVKSAIDNSYNVLRTRIDRFGVVQPNIQALEGQEGRIMVEMPGIKEPERVRKLLQGSANLEFWETYTTQEAVPYLVSLDQKLAAAAATESSEGTEAAAETAEAVEAAADTAKAEAPEANKAAKDLAELAKGADAKETAKAAQSDEQILKMPIAKILWHDTPANIAFWLADLSKSLAGRVNVSTSAPDYIEFNHADVSKGLCLQRLGELLGVPREEIIAAGDETNDLPMLAYAGLGIAMKNATQAVLDEADLVSPWTNDEDGLAKLIDRYLL